MQAAADRVRAVFGGLDVLIAAAGIQGPVGPFLGNPVPRRGTRPWKRI